MATATPDATVQYRSSNAYGGTTATAGSTVFATGGKVIGGFAVQATPGAAQDAKALGTQQDHAFQKEGVVTTSDNLKHPAESDFGLLSKNQATRGDRAAGSVNLGTAAVTMNSDSSNLGDLSLNGGTSIAIPQNRVYLPNASKPEVTTIDGVEITAGATHALTSPSVTNNLYFNGGTLAYGNYASNAAPQMPYSPPVAAPVRKAVPVGNGKETLQKLADTSAKQAEQVIAEERSADAQKSLPDTLEKDPASKKAVTLLSQLEQPDYFNKTISPQLREKVEQAKQYFTEAQGFYDSGRLNEAKKRTEQILAIDPYNRAAREFEERIDNKMSDVGVAAYNETRANMTKGVDLAWQRPVSKLKREAGASASTDSDKDGLANEDERTRTPNPDYSKSDRTADKFTRRQIQDQAYVPNSVYVDAARDTGKPLLNTNYFQKVSPAEKKEGEAVSAKKISPSPLIPQPEIATAQNAFSTFSLNVSDVAFKLAAASLEQGHLPDPSSLRSEEFINAFDYRDPEAAPGAPLAFTAEQARYPFAQNRDLLRFSVKTAAAGRQPGRPLNIVLLLDKSGSMERADRVNIVREALRVLATQLQPQDKLSIITFARTPRLWADGVAGNKVGEMIARVSEITPEGGTNLEAALDLGYATALRYYAVGNISRVILFTDGAANLGDVDPEALTKKVEARRKQGVDLDCFGIGWEGYNDDLLEQLTRNGNGRYGFINTPEDAATNFAPQLAGALQVAASDVKVQVEFNPRRVTAYRQIGYAKHQLTKEQFRDNTVAAAQIGAAESGNALYVVEVDPRGEGDLAMVHVRFRVPGTSEYREHAWTVPFTGNAPSLEEASPALRLAGAAGAFSEMLAASPYAAEVTSDRLLGLINGVPAVYGADPRPQKLEWMIRQARSLNGR
jgi:Mg-chelatase subunit ChlD